MKIAVVNETSAGDKNPHIVSALEGRGHEMLNVGMKEKGGYPELTYIHTGFLAALLLNAGRADIVVGGCGTGQGFLNSCMQYAGVFCGLITDALDAWLFRQINGGNCLSLALNKGYGWGGDINLRFIFDRIFSVERGCGYPEHRQEPQRQARLTLEDISTLVHRSYAEIVDSLSDEVILPALEYPGIKDLVDVDTISDAELKAALQRRYR